MRLNCSSYEGLDIDISDEAYSEEQQLNEDTAVKSRQRAEAQRLTEEFLSRGGKIKR